MDHKPLSLRTKRPLASLPSAPGPCIINSKPVATHTKRPLDRSHSATNSPIPSNDERTPPQPKKRTKLSQHDDHAISPTAPATFPEPASPPACPSNTTTPMTNKDHTNQRSISPHGLSPNPHIHLDRPNAREAHLRTTLLPLIDTSRPARAFPTVHSHSQPHARQHFFLNRLSRSKFHRGEIASLNGLFASETAEQVKWQMLAGLPGIVGGEAVGGRKGGEDEDKDDEENDEIDNEFAVPEWVREIYGEKERE